MEDSGNSRFVLMHAVRLHCWVHTKECRFFTLLDWFDCIFAVTDGTEKFWSRHFLLLNPGSTVYESTLYYWICHFKISEKKRIFRVLWLGRVSWFLKKASGKSFQSYERIFTPGLKFSLMNISKNSHDASQQNYLYTGILH